MSRRRTSRSVMPNVLLLPNGMSERFFASRPGRAALRLAGRITAPLLNEISDFPAVSRYTPEMVLGYAEDNAARVARLVAEYQATGQQKQLNLALIALGELMFIEQMCDQIFSLWEIADEVDALGDSSLALLNSVADTPRRRRLQTL